MTGISPLQHAAALAEHTMIFLSFAIQQGVWNRIEL